MRAILVVSLREATQAAPCPKWPCLGGATPHVATCRHSEEFWTIPPAKGIPWHAGVAPSCEFALTHLTVSLPGWHSEAGTPVKSIS